MGANATFPELARIEDLGEGLTRLASLGVWRALPGRMWSPPFRITAPVRSLLAALSERGESASEPPGPAEPVRSLAEAEPLARRIGEHAAALAPGLPPSALRGLRFSSEELAANIAQHARAAATGFLSVNRDGPSLLLWASDCGVGVEASLRENPEFATRISGPGEAIALAVERGVTRVPGRGNMGIGLRFVSEFALAAGGEIAIASGAALWRKKAASGGAAPAFVERVAPWKGTIVVVEIPAP